MLCADVSNVETVIVGGEFRKRAGTLLGDLDKARDALRASTEALTAAVAAKQPA